MEDGCADALPRIVIFTEESVLIAKILEACRVHYVLLVGVAVMSSAIIGLCSSSMFARALKSVPVD